MISYLKGLQQSCYQQHKVSSRRECKCGLKGRFSFMTFCLAKLKLDLNCNHIITLGIFIFHVWGRINVFIRSVSVCLSVCLSACLCLPMCVSVWTINFEWVHIETWFFVLWYILTISWYQGHWINVKVISWNMAHGIHHLDITST